jgi:DNA-binding NarL/FixJ family response regulator
MRHHFQAVQEWSMNSPQEKFFEVLIVEDNARFRQMLRKILQSRFPSFHIAEAENAEAALGQVHQQRPNVIFMDIRLPGQSGISLTGQIKPLYPAIVIIMLTHADTSEYREAALESGADYFLSKEKTTTEDIVDLVQRIAGRAGAIKNSAPQRPTYRNRSQEP